jgi:transcriptional regulator with XRE-family HTH domain
MIYDKLQPLAAQIRIFRDKLGLSQEELAEKCGFDRTYISLIERARRNISLLNLLKLSDGLETDISVLLEVYNATNSNK